MKTIRIHHVLKRSVPFALAAVLASAAVPGMPGLKEIAGISAEAATIIQPGLNLDYGPGGSITQTSKSPDAADYMSTGGVAKGSMSISTVIPAGCIDSCALDSVNPIVESKDLYSYSDMEADLKELQAKYPSWMSLRSLGTTADGRCIYDAVIGNEYADTQILITASIHAREYITTLLCMKQIEYMLQYAGNGAFDGKSLSDWYSNVCFHFVPMINPDGVSISQFGTAGISNPGLLEILNTAYQNDLALNRTTLEFEPYLTRWKANANGVNLNDNFNALTSNITVKTGTPSADVYYGTPGSEAETKALQALADSVHFKAAINYHAMGGVIYWNYAENKLVEHARDLAQNLNVLTGYTLADPGAEGGSFKAYLGTRRLPVTTLTIEVGKSQAPVDFAEFETIWGQNKFVPFYTMKWAKEKGK